MHVETGNSLINTRCQSTMAGFEARQEHAAYEVINVTLEDIPVIQKLLAAGVPECLAKYTIWSSCKLQPYLKSIVNRKASNDQLYLLRAWGAVVAVVFLRVVETSIWINNVVVDESFRGCSLGSYLLAKAVQRHGELHGCSLVEWESVINDERWHRHLDGTLKGCRSAWVGKLPSEQCPIHAFVRLEELPTAYQEHQQYGFSSFSVITQTKRYRVGRLGEDYFRIVDTQGLRDQDLMTSLSSLDRRRDLLVFAQDNDPNVCPNRFRKVATLVHFESPIFEFVQRCAAAVRRQPDRTETKDI
jgi:GNAT superfamily N-acetyltransferase